jgi:hypothetical protein
MEKQSGKIGLPLYIPIVSEKNPEAGVDVSNPVNLVGDLLITNAAL